MRCRRCCWRPGPSGIVPVAERDRIAAERDALASQNDRLRHPLLKLKRMQFGAKSERLPEEQLQLGLEDLEQAIAQGEAEAERRDPGLKHERAAKRRANRDALPAHLPRVEVTLEPEDTACPCCRGDLVVIGHDSAERLDVIPAQFQVMVTRRPKLACRVCERVVVQASAPARLVEGGLATEALVAHVLVARYADNTLASVRPSTLKNKSITNATRYQDLRGFCLCLSTAAVTDVAQFSVIATDRPALDNRSFAPFGKAERSAARAMIAFAQYDRHYTLIAEIGLAPRTQTAWSRPRPTSSCCVGPGAATARCCSSHRPAGRKLMTMLFNDALETLAQQAKPRPERPPAASRPSQSLSMSPAHSGRCRLPTAAAQRTSCWYRTELRNCGAPPLSHMSRRSVSALCVRRCGCRNPPRHNSRTRRHSPGVHAGLAKIPRTLATTSIVSRSSARNIWWLD